MFNFIQNGVVHQHTLMCFLSTDVGLLLYYIVYVKSLHISLSIVENSQKMCLKANGRTYAIWHKWLIKTSRLFLIPSWLPSLHLSIQTDALTSEYGLKDLSSWSMFRELSECEHGQGSCKHIYVRMFVCICVWLCWTLDCRRVIPWNVPIQVSTKNIQLILKVKYFLLFPFLNQWQTILTTVPSYSVKISFLFSC